MYFSSYWNEKGNREILSLDELILDFDEHQTRIAAGWSRKDTLDAIWNAKKMKAEHDGIDPFSVKKPNKKTVLAYHSALASTDKVSIRTARPKPVYRDVAETSVSNMLLTAEVMLVSHCIIVNVPVGREFK